MAVTVSQIAERSWAQDKFGDSVLSWKWDWRDERIMAWINNFARISRENVMGNVGRLDMTRKGHLKRSLYWQTYAASGGDSQVFEARYLYYGKFVELAVGKGDRYDSPVPDIPHRAWGPIPVPTRRRRGKPFVVADMRSQAVKFSSYARKHFSFVGTMFMIYAMGNNQSAAAAYNRAVFFASKKDTFTR